MRLKCVRTNETFEVMVVCTVCCSSTLGTKTNIFELLRNFFKLLKWRSFRKNSNCELDFEFPPVDIVTWLWFISNRRGPGQEYLKETLQELVETINNTENELNLEVNPVKVYCAVHNVVDDERNSITMEKALKDKQVKEVIEGRLKDLENITSKFFNAVVNSLDYVPYGIRWLCKAIYQLCQVRKFVRNEWSFKG